MFYERHDSLMLDSNMSFLSDGVYDEMCATNPLKDEHWEKMQNLLPTPPCSPEDFCYQAFPDLPAPANLQEGLQVVPMKKVVQLDNLLDSEIEPLPVLELSDEEMQKLTSPTVFDDSIWLLSNPPPASTLPTRDQFESKNASDVNCISHGIRKVHISDSLNIGTSPGFSQSFILTVNANPIQPLNTVGHLATREVFMSQNATTWSLNSDPNFMNERTTRVGTFEATTQAVMPESPTKKGRRVRRLSRNTQEAPAVVVASEENAGDSEDSETTRATHNVLERKRREELKDKFQRLRDCLPELHDNDRAPKVLILKKSYEYVRFLEQEEQRLLADKELERQRLIILLNRRQLLLSM